MFSAFKYHRTKKKPTKNMLLYYIEKYYFDFNYSVRHFVECFLTL